MSALFPVLHRAASFHQVSLNPGTSLVAAKSNLSLHSVSQTLEKKCVVL